MILSIDVMQTIPVLLRLLVIVGLTDLVKGRGHLIDPPMRSSLWRYYPWNQMNVPQNVDDTGLNCGGFWRLHEINGGKCGLCGDSYDEVRKNEAGGKYANGYIVKKYYQDDQFMNITVDVLSNIGGYFEFHLCPNDNVTSPITQECLDKYPLTIEGYGSRYVPDTAVKHNLFLKIPDGVTCSQCVLQWKWIGGNNWGVCPDGYGGLGCGKQEEYYNCADISILPPSGNRPKLARAAIVNRNPAPLTTTQNPIMPILPPFIQRSEKYKKFYKKYIENVMKGMVAGKWSDNAISSLEYKLEKQKRTNQSEQRTFWVPNRTSDFRLTGEYPDWSRPSLSVKMPDVLQQNTVYSFMDIVKKNLKNGETESSSRMLVDRPVITGRPVYLPEGPVSVPLPTTTIPTPPSTTTTSSVKINDQQTTIFTPTGDPVLDKANFRFLYNPRDTTPRFTLATQNVPMTTTTPLPRNTIPPLTTSSPIMPNTENKTQTKSAITTTSSQNIGRINFPEFDYDQIRNNRIIAQRIPYYLHTSALRTPTDPITSFFDSMMSVFSPASADYPSEVPYYDVGVTEPLYTNYPSDIYLPSVDSQIAFNNLQKAGLAEQRNLFPPSSKKFVSTKTNTMLSEKAPQRNSFISRGLSSGTGVLRSGERRGNSPEVTQVRNQPDIPSRQLSSNDGRPGMSVKDSAINELRFAGNMFL